MSPGPVAPILQAVRDLAPAISDLSTEIETERRLPQQLVDDLTAAQVFQLYQPRSIGGPEVDPLTAFEVCEELARADGSVGWCAQVSAAVTVFLAWIDPDALAEMAATSDRPLHVAGSARPLGTAIRTDDGYRIKGHWNYASGVRHANWFLGTCFVDAAGSQTTRSMLIPIEDGEVVANWDVVGMRGTGSDDFVIDDVDVPRSRIGANHWIQQRSEPLYSPKLAMIATWAPTAGVAIGLAQGALDALTNLADHTSTSSPTPLGDRDDVQQAVAEAEAITSAARAFCVEAIGGAWTALANGDEAGLARAVARAQIAITHSMSEAVRVSDLCFHAAGTNAISTENRLERFFRDAHTAAQHAAGQSIHKRVAGRTLLNRSSGAADQQRTGPSTPRS